MPRASKYLLEGHTYHLTHRCHGREFLLNARSDRNRYREWLREGVHRFAVPVYAFCITRNHVHVVVHAEDREAVSRLMHLASGAVAKHYNIRHERVGSMWEHPYHCTVIQDGRHLLNCLRYVDLNMVRARVVGHPRDWAWCGYDELIGQRKRYRILNLDHLRQRLGWRSVSELQQWYAEAIDQQVARQLLSREPHWTESLAVGEQDFVERVARNYRARTRFEYTHSPDGLCCVREARVPYSTGEAP